VAIWGCGRRSLRRENYIIVTAIQRVNGRRSWFFRSRDYGRQATPGDRVCYSDDR